MRKMYSENQIKDIVNKGIEDGSIHADPSTEVKVEDINSETATAGKVIVANGTGGASWGSAGMEVVELTATSGTLSDSDFTKLSGANGMIKYNDFIYGKIKETSTQIWYGETYLNGSSSDINQKYFIIYKSNKMFSYDTNSWSKPNVVANPTLVGTEASLTALQVGSTKYKVGGSEVLAYEGTSLLASGVVFDSWTLHRAIKDGNILWIVLSGNVKNTSESAQYVQDFYSLSLPSDIQQKIYRLDGTTINNNYSSDTTILNTVVANPSSSSPYQLKLKSESAGSFKVAFSGLVTLSSNSTISIDVRIPIFLDIGA